VGLEGGRALKVDEEVTSHGDSDSKLESADEHLVGSCWHACPRLLSRLIQSSGSSAPLSQIQAMSVATAQD
jgi:hypothetical protein